MLAALRRCAVVALVAGMFACDEKPKDPAPSDSPPVVSPGALAIDSGVLGEGALATDPPAPPGDLAAELGRYVNLDTCVADRAKLDPLVGDAINAIGYDTLVRDSCRLLEAAKDKKTEGCERISAAPLRRQCVSWVAIVALEPDRCPLEFEGAPARGRVASCVAIAARDVRLCAAETRLASRTTCEALVQKDAKRCEALLPGARASCVRELTRWQNVLSSPLEGLPPLPRARARLALPGSDAGADGGVAPETELGDLVARGVIALTAHERVRLEIGALIESDGSRIAAIPQLRPRFAAAILGDARGATMQKLELVLPGDPPFVSPPAACDCKVTRFSGEARRGAPVSVRVEGTAFNGVRHQPFSIDVETWVRDVVNEPVGEARRTIPALAPRATGRDGG